MQEEASQLRGSLKELRGSGDWMGSALDEDDDVYNHDLDHDCALLAKRLKVRANPNPNPNPNPNLTLT